MKLKDIKSIHFTGIKGVAMTALALCAQDLGIKVTGTDTEELFVTDEVLAKRKIKWEIGFKVRDWERKPDLLITTGAHGGVLNPEVVSAKAVGIPVMTQGEALTFFGEGKDLIVSCGVGGKTTTASMVASLLDFAGLNPSYAIGVGEIFPLGYPGKYDDKGKYFICEGDEFAISPDVDNRPKFSLLSPKILIATNIEHDHPDIYPTIEDTKKAFKELFEKVPKDGLLVASADNKIILELIGQVNVPCQTYGFSKSADYQITNVEVEGQKTLVEILDKKGDTYKLILKVPGEYNIKNALATFVVGKFLGIPDQEIVNGIEKFSGTKRRFENIGLTKSGVMLIDDYAHHPEEIKAVLLTAKKYFPNQRIIAIFQPHTYSRTKVLFKEFAKSFINADLIALMDIYSSAREIPDKEVTSEKLAKEAMKYHKDVYYSGNHEETIKWFSKYSQKGDIVLTLGAGDIFYLHNQMLKI
jgi:UDP-N-acetylmuramate--alanine ligase